MERITLSQSQQRQSDRLGFTLLELIIVGGLLAMIFVTVSTLFMASLTNSLKTTSWQALRQEGTSALNIFASQTRNARSVISCSTSALEIDNPDQTKSKFSTTTTAGGNTSLVATAVDDTETDFSGGTSQYLTSPEYQLSDLNFSCSNSGEQPFVVLEFSLTKTSAAIPEITQQFRRTVLLRNPS